MKDQIATVKHTPITAFKEQVQRQDLLQKIKDRLPADVNADKFLTGMVQVVASSPKLLEADRASLFLSVLEIAQAGLSIRPSMQQAFLIPRWNRQKRINCVTALLGYKGLMKLAKRGSGVQYFKADVICEGDKVVMTDDSFSCVFGPIGNRGEVIGAFATAVFADGHKEYAVMSRQEIEVIKEKHAPKRDGVITGDLWTVYETEAFKKTALRRLCKMLDLDDNAQNTIEKLDTHDFEVGHNEAMLGSEPTEPTEPTGTTKTTKNIDTLDKFTKSLNTQQPQEVELEVEVAPAPVVETKTSPADFWARDNLAIPIKKNTDGGYDFRAWNGRLFKAIGAVPDLGSLDRLLSDNKANFAVVQEVQNESVTYLLEKAQRRRTFLMQAPTDPTLRQAYNAQAPIDKPTVSQNEVWHG